MAQVIDVPGMGMVEFPDGMSDDQIASAIKANMPQTDAKPAARARAGLGSMAARQIGLTGRYALEGVGQAADVVAEPVNGLMRWAGLGATAPSQTAGRLADSLGLPKPQGAFENVIGEATKMGFGAAAPAGVAGKLLPAATGTAGKALLSGLSDNVAAQIGGGVGSGAASAVAREADAPAAGQIVSSLVGGVAGGLAGDKMMRVGQVLGEPLGRLARLDPLPKELTPKSMDNVQLASTLRNRLSITGGDWDAIPAKVQASILADVRKANSLENLDARAVQRLADFRALGVTPTLGTVTLDPVQITREMNLAKMGANSADGGLQRLARVQNQNNARLIDVMNESGANRGDPFRAGQQAIGAIQGRDADMASRVTSLYQQARDTSGRAADLDRVAFSTRVSELLDDAMVGGALPKDVESMVNWIANNAKPQGMHGSIPMPFNVDIAEQLKTRIATLQRNTSDGSARHALGLVRQALDETPLMSAPTVNPGNLPSVPGTVPPSPMQLGQESINAFNQARNAARQRFGWQESARPIEAALNGAQPDKFVENFVIRGSVADASAVARNAPTEEVQTAILAYLKDKALGGAADEVGKFSQSAYNKALNQIGDRKLSLFFTPEEVSQLRTVGRVASYLQAQPSGSAVNNSNSGALMVGKGIDLLTGISSKIPLLNIDQQVDALTTTLWRNPQAMNATRGLFSRPVPQGALLGNGRAGLGAAGLLATPSLSPAEEPKKRKDDHRK